ncbi:glycine cleavage system protein GcvH [Stieleria sp. ICT_E10.1]|uniref:glycine cleavage system protein GcvH n=1 Tax=Stieleria sedimenti TaxID=2976331 RepID=UPI0021803887|nr:glycine cleavage system protein GcvH [Stieleria sedimenti]MCS7471563.1 glycine cleavage system protein GcvH [Stieleria sedimenti]
MSRDKSKLLYAETHEWVDVAEEGGQKIATIGISGFAIEQLNDLVYMELPEVGKTIDAGEEFGEVESVKAVSPLYSPVGGEVIEVHAELPDNLDQLNDDPYDFGWIVKLKIVDESALENLMDFAAYEKQCAESG